MRPYIICHMMASLDGRIDCAMTEKIDDGEEYYEALEELGCQAQLNGRVTAELHYALPEKFIAKDKTPVGELCWEVARQADNYHVIMDTHGTLMYEKDNIYGAPAIVIVSESAPKAYVDYLSSIGISWIAAGKGKIDLAAAMSILHDDFKILSIALTGGGLINGAFLQAGLIDEVSMQFAPGIDGRKGWNAAFDGIEDQDFGPVKLTLTSVKQYDNGVVWMRYKTKNNHMNQTFLTLNNGRRIPQFGLGVYQVPGDAATKQACLEAFKLGYRHIDTAHAYQNERGVGQAVRESGIPRDEIFITSKLWPSEYGDADKAIDKMLARLDIGYIDLLLLHQQVGDYIAAYKAMERAVAAGKVRSIGLSNFESERLEEVLAIAAIPPAAIQVECHPYFAQKALKERVVKYGTILESWYPIGHGDKGLIGEPVFTELGKKYGKTNVQIILRWHIQEGNVVFPRSTNPVHIQENMDIFDFVLTEDEMNQIRSLDKGKRYWTMPLKDQEGFAMWKPED